MKRHQAIKLVHWKVFVGELGVLVGVLVVLVGVHGVLVGVLGVLVCVLGVLVGVLGVLVGVLGFLVVFRIWCPFRVLCLKRYAGLRKVHHRRWWRW